MLFLSDIQKIIKNAINPRLNSDQSKPLNMIVTEQAANTNNIINKKYDISKIGAVHQFGGEINLNGDTLVADVAGEGVLKFVWVGGQYYNYTRIKIVLDGITLIFGEELGRMYGTTTCIGLASLDLYFASSCKIYGYATSTIAGDRRVNGIIALTKS